MLYLVALPTFYFFLFPALAFAQTDEKAVMTVQNYTNETISMNFAYVFGDYSWSLMERDIPVNSDLTYKIPTGLPGCEYLKDWEIDDALLVISSGQQEICRQEISLCEKREVGIEVHSRACRIR